MESMICTSTVASVGSGRLGDWKSGSLGSLGDWESGTQRQGMIGEPGRQGVLPHVVFLAFVAFLAFLA